MEQIEVIIMESIIKIRRRILRDGESIRSVSRRTGLSRHTIRKYLGEGSEPRYQRSQPPVRHKLQAYEERLQSLYEQNLGLPRRASFRSLAHRLEAV